MCCVWTSFQQKDQQREDLEACEDTFSLIEKKSFDKFWNLLLGRGTYLSPLSMPDLPVFSPDQVEPERIREWLQVSPPSSLLCPPNKSRLVSTRLYRTLLLMHTVPTHVLVYVTIGREESQRERRSRRSKASRSESSTVDLST